jgi:Kef-type K+ transport system membrane component KefB
VLGFVALSDRFRHRACLRSLSKAAKRCDERTNVFRQIFFLLTFFAIGLMADLKKLWHGGIGRLAAVYVICLFGFIIWVGLIISWVFFHGVQPPIASG